MTMNQMGRS
jgi:hypothetical protein